MHLSRNHYLPIPILMSCLFLIGVACSSDPAARLADPNSTDDGYNNNSNTDNNNNNNGDDTLIYKDGKCAYQCVWNDGNCTNDLKGDVVKGDCTDDQVCCQIPNVDAKPQCLGSCIMEWESCQNGASITDGNCSGAQMKCCETGDEVPNDNQGFDTTNDNDNNKDTGTPGNTDTGTGGGNTNLDTDYTVDGEIDAIDKTYEEVLEEDNTVVDAEDQDLVEQKTEGQFRVDENGNITENGSIFHVRCGNWFGLEGQHEPKDAENNPDGAPMELYIGNMWWNESGRTIQKTMTEIKELGINMIRFPIAPQTLDPTDPQGIGSVQEGGVLKNSTSELQENARQAMEDFIKLADENDLKVLVDIHSCSNYVGWRAGRLDAAPPYVDAEREDYDFTREGYTCASGKDEYNESKWLDNIKEIAGLPDALGVDNIIGIDIFNEPWDYTWEEWKDLAEKAYQAINSENSDILIFVEGIGSATSDEVKIPHGSPETNPNWGENFYNFKEQPMNIPKERLVLSPHTYGPSVYVQKQFLVSEACRELEGDEAGDNDCPIEIIPEKLKPGWEEHFGYLRSQGYAMVIGEFGGNREWPANTSRAMQDRWSHITTPVDMDWQNTFVDYMIEKNIQGCYWAINPESGDTGGLYSSPYREGTNESAWGQWTGFDSTKTDLMKHFWSGLESN